MQLVLCVHKFMNYNIPQHRFVDILYLNIELTNVL